MSKHLLKCPSRCLSLLPPYVVCLQITTWTPGNALLRSSNIIIKTQIWMEHIFQFWTALFLNTVGQDRCSWSRKFKKLSAQLFFLRAHCQSCPSRSL
ncbi:hypothetical protein BDW60DRAFT_192250 [Aspergillus nidulans var. acristatus]